MSYLDDLFRNNANVVVEQNGTIVTPNLSTMNIVNGNVVYDTILERHNITFDGALPPYDGGDKVVYTPDGVTATWISITELGMLPEDMSNVVVGNGTGPEIRQLDEDDILPGFAITSFTLAGTNLDEEVEVGTTISNIVAGVSTNYVPVAGSIIDNASGTWALPSPYHTGTRSGANVTKTTNNHSYTATVSVTYHGHERTAVHTIYWRPYVYHGPASVPGAYNEAFVESLTYRNLQANRATTITDTMGSGEYQYYCLPTSYGTPTFQYGVLPGGWTLVAQTYLTNTYNNVTQLYDIWQTNQPDLGTITWVVS